MSVAIQISFLSGQFHATPWGRHVNEGEPEWPPSPWRLLRAMAAVWKRKLHNDPRVDELLPNVIRKLVVPPLYHLPPATAAHTRHFMPWHKNWTPEYPHRAKTEVFDAFVVLDRTATLVVGWPDVELDEYESAVTDLVLERVNYLGRAESWVDMRLTSMPPFQDINCVCRNHRDIPLTGLEDPVDLIAPDPATWNAWNYGPNSAKPDPAWNLLAETTDLRSERWSHCPGSRTLTYLRPADALAAQGTYRARKTTGIVHTARFTLDAQTLPRLTETVYLGELARQFLQGVFGRLFDGEQSKIFSGKDDSGNPLDGHQHAFFLPTDDDGDGKLDHITVYCADGFGNRELRALDEWRRMRRPGGGVDLNLMLVGLLKKDDPGINDSPALLGSARIWHSVTPFILTRHFKKRGTKRDTCSTEKFPEIVLREEIRRRGLPEPTRVTQMERCRLWDHEKRTPAPSRKSLSWLEFRRERVFGNGRCGSHPGCGFEIEFAEPVFGPIALGYGCHFGLGLFAPLN